MALSSIAELEAQANKMLGLLRRPESLEREEVLNLAILAEKFGTKVLFPIALAPDDLFQKLSAAVFTVTSFASLMGSISTEKVRIRLEVVDGESAE